MGAVCSISIPSSEEDVASFGSPAVLPVRENLLFPNEILEKIMSFLSCRDKLISREVCLAWLSHVNVAGKLHDHVTVNVKSDELNQLAARQPVFTRFYFYKVDLTRQSSNFWNSYSDLITHLDFYDCAVIPRNTSDPNQVEFTLGCPNLKHLGLVNCDKYFLMGGKFIQLNEILCLENLESLNLSRNKNLTDNILFSILLKTKKLQTLDLSDCVNMVFMKAVHNRFYVSESTSEPVRFSDNVLSFHTLCHHFLCTERARHMKAFNFGMKLNSTGMGLILSCEDIKWEKVNLESPELKSGDIKTFLDKNQSSLLSVKLGRCKLISEEIHGANLLRLRELDIHDTRSITTLNFLIDLGNIQKLLLDGLIGFDLQHEVFANFRNLKELSLNGIKPTRSPEECRQELLQIFILNKGLTALDVGNSSYIVNDDVLQGIIKNLRRLKRLNIESSNVSDYGLTGFRSAAQYEEATTKDSPCCLSGLSEMEHLNLSHCRDLGELTWQKALNLRNLVSLNLSNCNTLSKRGILSIITKCRNIERLILIHCSRQILTDPDVLMSAREKLYRCKEITY